MLMSRQRWLAYAALIYHQNCFMSAQQLIKLSGLKEYGGQKNRPPGLQIKIGAVL